MDLTLYLSFIITSSIIADAVGDEQILKCENSVNARNCLWQRQGLNGAFTDIPPDDAKYYKRHTTTMTIKKFTSTDSGVYRCRLFWESTNNRYSSPIELKVIEKGTTLTLQCSMGGNAPYIGWEKRSLRKFKEVLRNKTLTLQNIQYTNAGTYRCKYSWPLWLSSWFISCALKVVTMALKSSSSSATKASSVKPSSFLEDEHDVCAS
ncbi:unnamed protein product [Mytilus coruscus]|uniref:Ig-like domain-containing protein n=1 Tax=Mytilus coruscus TaxID=42192 RepID=A0A6J8BVW6_MYTCO|nr:unnamed protein product [Mytilus coruscus]